MWIECQQRRGSAVKAAATLQRKRIVEVNDSKQGGGQQRRCSIQKGTRKTGSRDLRRLIETRRNEDGHKLRSDSSYRLHAVRVNERASKEDTASGHGRAVVAASGNTMRLQG